MLVGSVEVTIKAGGFTEYRILVIDPPTLSGSTAGRSTRRVVTINAIG